MAEYYPYHRVEDKICTDNMDHWIQYRVTAKEIDTKETVPYLLDFMRIGRLWITDIYPEMWAEDPNRCRRLTSHENIHINFQRISNTSVKIYLNEFPADGTVMIISGSYQQEENQTEDSRRLKLYRFFFNKLKTSENFEITEATGLNGFFISHAGLTIDKKGLIEEYNLFKLQR